MNIDICDDGIGFDPAAPVRVNGIRNMKARVEQSLAGSFALVTAPGQGTRISIAVPLDNHEGAKETSNGSAK